MYAAASSRRPPPRPALRLVVAPRCQRLALRAQLEVPDCGCRPFEVVVREETVLVYPLCPHVRAAEHGWDVGRWWAWLHRAFPEEYASPPPPRDWTSTTPGSAARVECYRRRHEAGAGLWHGDDARYEGDDHLGRAVARRRNGSVEQCGLRVAGEADPEPTLAEALRAELEARAAQGGAWARAILRRVGGG